MFGCGCTRGVVRLKANTKEYVDEYFHLGYKFTHSPSHSPPPLPLTLPLTLPLVTGVRVESEQAAKALATTLAPGSTMVIGMFAAKSDTERYKFLLCASTTAKGE